MGLHVFSSESEALVGVDNSPLCGLELGHLMLREQKLGSRHTIEFQVYERVHSISIYWEKLKQQSGRSGRNIFEELNYRVRKS